MVNHFGKKISPKNFINQNILIGESGDLSIQFDGAILTVEAILKRTVVSATRTDLESLVVLWDGYVSAQIQSPMTVKTCGLCGNNDGKAANDMMTRRRGLTSSPNTFGESWKIDRFKRCPDTEAPRSPQEVCESDSYFIKKSECEAVFSNTIFDYCENIIGHDRAYFIESCIYDECMGIMAVPELPPKCIAAAAYATRCSNQFWFGAAADSTKAYDVYGWEELTGCPSTEAKYQPILDTGCPQPDA